MLFMVSSSNVSMLITFRWRRKRGVTMLRPPPGGPIAHSIRTSFNSRTPVSFLLEKNKHACDVENTMEVSETSVGRTEKVSVFLQSLMLFNSRCNHQLKSVSIVMVHKGTITGTFVGLAYHPVPTSFTPSVTCYKTLNEEGRIHEQRQATVRTVD